jgi:hypothetical protein
MNDPRVWRPLLATLALLGASAIAPAGTRAQPAPTPTAPTAEDSATPATQVAPTPVAPPAPAAVKEPVKPQAEPAEPQAESTQESPDDAQDEQDGQSVLTVEHSILKAVVARNDLLDQLTKQRGELAKAEAELKSAEQRQKSDCPPALAAGAAPAAKSPSCVEAEAAVQVAQTKRANLASQVVATRDGLDAAQTKLDELGAPEITTSKSFVTLKQRLARVLDVRCLTAICWGGPDGRRYGVEPLIDLPVGIVWSVGRGSLSSYINSSAMSVEFNAGLRLWVANDLFSVSAYFAKPVARPGDSIRLRGSQKSHSVDAIHRPYPSVGFGFFGDILHLGIAYDVLVNRSDERGDPSYPPNEVLSRSISFTLGVSTFTTARNAIAAGTEKGDKR